MQFTPSHLDELRAVVGDDGVLASEAARFTYEADALVLDRAMPDVVVLPRSTDEVAAVSDSIGNYIDWFQAIEHAIHERVDQ